ncbi:AgmX/PglI C-terminal domain-containing protein [Stigmatella sp. ncwal1]|uniref:AgmX/PglI C-terminal domain-containing protein n=1 Tax=Stigmatella ashevillensis TaxID=2995309 RepID=A0ABT5D447_9BACT|nr:AgmX/PglI C-terminal domain-containing protein [Stigmatella ashevillena]MDC0707814.1 AgmX/PglI C-terminal domain-containing protein [Stigmatella ashevillena]
MAAGHELEAGLSEEQWLFRQGDLVLGPLSGQQLVEKLYTGELTGDTLVAPPGVRDFQRLDSMEGFRVHVARAAAKMRVDAEMRLVNERKRRKRTLIGSTLGVVTLVLVGLAVWAGRRFAVHGPGGGEDEYADISVEMPTITLAQAPSEDEDLLAYPTQGAPSRPPDKAPGTGPSKPVAAASPASAAVPKKPRSGSVSTEPDGLDMGVSFDQGAINKVVATNQRTLFRCFKEEAERRPGFAAKVPIEFVIGNDGRVNKLWVDHPQLKDGALHKCLLGELQRWPFKPYKGSLASVGLSFTVGKKG